MYRFFFIIGLALITSCSESAPEPDEQNDNLPILNIEDAQVVESDGAVMRFRIRLSRAIPESIEIKYDVIGVTAEPDSDFDRTSNSFVLEANSMNAELLVPITNDASNEVEEVLEVVVVWKQERKKRRHLPSENSIAKGCDSVFLL